MRDDIHVTPINDHLPHTEARDCWCRPRVEACYTLDVLLEPDQLPSGHVVIHHSADGRELVEAHGVN